MRIAREATRVLLHARLSTDEQLHRYRSTHAKTINQKPNNLKHNQIEVWISYYDANLIEYRRNQMILHEMSEWTAGSMSMYPAWISRIGRMKHELRSPEIVAANRYMTHGFVLNVRRVKTKILNRWPIKPNGIMIKQKHRMNIIAYHLVCWASNSKFVSFNLG